jgi:hypothetical protein
LHKFFVVLQRFRFLIPVLFIVFLLDSSSQNVIKAAVGLVESVLQRSE